MTSPDGRPRPGQSRWLAVLTTLVVFVVAPGTVLAQHEHHPAARPDTAVRMADMPGMKREPATDTVHAMLGMMQGPLGISHVRMGSGTSWMPDSSPMHATHAMWGDWTVMLHGVAFGFYDNQGSRRGDRQLGIADWEMLMAMRHIGTGLLHLHVMASLEPATIGARGYPLLLQTGESYKGAPLHDRQHPHDFVMELAAMFQKPLARNLAAELYGGIAGEPALGPVAFMHRPSAQNDPFAPLGHHWQDATHISYGVLTAGLYSRRWKLEGSVFNGREPDENRWNVDLRRLDSYSGRLTVNPTGRLSISGWYGWLPSPEALHPDESVHRYGASVQYGSRGIAGGAWGSSLVWGANAHAGHAQNSIAAESNLEIGAKNAVFARAEYVRKSAEELVVPSVDPAREFHIQSLVGGYVREVIAFRGGTIGIGGRATANFVPSALAPSYGTRHPAGFAIYLRVRPSRMAKPMPMEMPMPAQAPASMSMPMPMPMARDSMADSVPAHHRFSIRSRALGEERQVNVWTPPGYVPSAAERWPVLYMPDGGMDEDFPHVVAAVDSLVKRGAIRNVIVVGIPNTQRRRDLTGPTRIKEDSAIAPRVGGSAAFRSFIRDELIPAVDAQYRTTGERAIIGESLAGLFVLETFFKEPDLFTHYVAIDPSLWWNDEALVKSAGADLAHMDAAPRTLYLTTANYAPTIASAERIATELRAASLPLLKWSYAPRPDLTHATIFRGVQADALQRALR